MYIRTYFLYEQVLLALARLLHGQAIARTYAGLSILRLLFHWVWVDRLIECLFD